MLDNTDKLANKKTGSKTGKKMYKILTNVENALEKYLILCVKIKIIIKTNLSILTCYHAGGKIRLVHTVYVI